jgi:hypothetical protein
MSDMRRLLEAMDSMSRAETKPTGPKFPGYWKGTDPASAAKNKMVGGAEQESVIPELAKTAKKKSTEWELEEAFQQFKEAGEFRRDVVPQPPVNTTLPPGYGTPLPKLDAPTGDQSGGFKKVQPGEPFDKVNNPLYTGDSKPPEAGDPGLGVKIPTDTFSRPNAQGIRPQARFKSDKEPIELKKQEPPVSVAGPEQEKVDAQNNSIKVNPATGNVDSSLPTNKPKLAGPEDTFIKDKNGEWIENPKYSKTNIDISPEEMDQISRQANWQDAKSGPVKKNNSVDTKSLPPATSNNYYSPRAAVTTPDHSAVLDAFTNAQQANQKRIDDRAAMAATSPADAAQMKRDYQRSIVNPEFTNDLSNAPDTPITPAKAPAANAGRSIVAPASSSDVVTKAQLDAYRRDSANPNATLGQYMNQQRGLTARKGGANDPAVIAAKQKPAAPAPQVKPTPTPPAERNQTPPTVSEPGIKPPVPRSTNPAPAPENKAPSVYGSEKRKADQEKLDKLEKERQVDQGKGIIKRSAPKQTSSTTSNPSSAQQTSAPTPEPNISSQAGQDAQWEKDKQMMKGLLPDWLKGGSSSTNKSQPVNDTRRQADIAALQREIKRTPANEKTRLGILNQELNKAQQPATNETFSQRLAKDFEQFLESDEPYAGYDQDVEKLKQRAKLGPMKTVWDEKTQRYRVVPVKPQEKEIKEYGNAQNADQQATNADQQQTSHAVDPSNPDAMAQKVDIATAKSTMSGLKNILGPQLDTNAAASGIVKMNDGQPLSVPERQAISTLTPLVSKAAEMPATAGALKSALSTAGVLAKQGK